MLVWFPRNRRQSICNLVRSPRSPSSSDAVIRGRCSNVVSSHSICGCTLSEKANPQNLIQSSDGLSCWNRRAVDHVGIRGLSDSLLFPSAILEAGYAYRREN